MANRQRSEAVFTSVNIKVNQRQATASLRLQLRQLKLELKTFKQLSAESIPLTLLRSNSLLLISKKLDIFLLALLLN